MALPSQAADTRRVVEAMELTVNGEIIFVELKALYPTDGISAMQGCEEIERTLEQEFAVADDDHVEQSSTDASSPQSGRDDHVESHSTVASSSQSGRDADLDGDGSDAESAATLPMLGRYNFKQPHDSED